MSKHSTQSTKDINHAWNDGRVIRTKKQQCGCHITAKKFTLCIRGEDCKGAADGWYKLWQAQKDTPIDPVIIRSHFRNFEIHRNAYIKHLETGKDWVL